MSIWKDTAERYIAVIDIMGIKDFILKKDHLSVKSRIDIFHQIMLDSVESLKKSVDQDYHIDDILKFTFYSDTILIVSKDDSEFSLQNLLIACQVLMASCMFERIQVRGVISYGTITADFNDSLFFGRALVDANHIIDQLHMYGMLVDNRVEKKTQQYANKVIDEYCILQKVPTKSGMIRYYSVNWMETATRISLIKPDRLLNGLYQEISGANRKYLDNTLDFYYNLPQEITDSIESIIASKKKAE